MRSGVVIIVDVISQDAAQVIFTDDDQMIETLSANRWGRMTDDLSNCNYFNAGWDFRDGQERRSGEGFAVGPRSIHVNSMRRSATLALIPIAPYTRSGSIPITTLTTSPLCSCADGLRSAHRLGLFLVLLVDARLRGLVPVFRRSQI